MPDHDLAPQLLQRIVVGNHVPAPTSSILFRNIPQHFQHLGVRIIAQFSATDVTVAVDIDYNPDRQPDDTISGPWAQIRHILQTTLSGTTSSALASPQFGVITGSNASNLLKNPGIIEGTIYCYSSVHWRYKSWTSRSWAPAQNSTSNIEQYFNAGTADFGTHGPTLQSLKFSVAAGNFLVGSQFDLIGHP